MKRTTITVPSSLVSSLQKITRTASKTRAVLTAIQGEIKRQKLARFRSLAGRIKLDSSALKERHHDHRLR